MPERESKVITAKLSDVKSLPERDRHILRFYVMGGNKTEVRYRDEPEVREILRVFLRAADSSQPGGAR